MLVSIKPLGSWKLAVYIFSASLREWHILNMICFVAFHDILNMICMYIIHMKFDMPLAMGGSDSFVSIVCTAQI